MDIYARVEQGVIMEFPVYLTHIETRMHPIALYTKCNAGTPPSITELQFLKQAAVLAKDGTVSITYTAVDYPLESLLAKLPNDTLPKAVRDRQEKPSVALLARIDALVRERVQSRLDSFVGTRGYGTPPGSLKSIETAISYIGSKNPIWDAEGRYAKELRETTWEAVDVYLSDIRAVPQLRPWPKTWQEIADALPAAMWPAIA